MLKSLLQRVAFQAAGLVALAFATGVAMVAAAFGLYALLRISLPAAASAALTALAAAVLVAGLAVVLIRLDKRKPAPGDGKVRTFEPEKVQRALSIGAAVMSVVAGQVLRWRQRSHPETHRRTGVRKRR